MVSELGHSTLYVYSSCTCKLVHLLDNGAGLYITMLTWHLLTKGWNRIREKYRIMDTDP